MDGPPLSATYPATAPVSLGVCFKPRSCQNVLTVLTDGDWQRQRLKEAHSSSIVFRDSFPMPPTALTLVGLYVYPSLGSPRTSHTTWEPHAINATMGFYEYKISVHTKTQKSEICFLLRLLANAPSSSPSSPPRNPLDYSLTQHWNP